MECVAPHDSLFETWDSEFRRRMKTLFASRCFAAADGGFGSGANRALDGDVQQRRASGGECSIQCRREILGAFDKLAVTTQALHDLLVTSLQQVSGHRSAVEAQLDLPVDTPGRIVTEYADDIELVAHRRVEFHRVKSERAVAGEHDHPSVRIGEFGGERLRQ